MTNSILIIDDDQWFLQRVCMVLENSGYVTFCAKNGAEALARLKDVTPDLILLDVLMPEEDGFAIFERIREREESRDIPVLFVTSIDDKETITRCFEIGGADYIGKPLRHHELLARIELYLKLSRKDEIITSIETENEKLKDNLLCDELPHENAFSSIITVNTRMRSIFKYVEAIAKSSRAVLVTGETGVGKELIAKMIHKLSGRKGRFVTVNVAGLDETLFSDTLFGHQKGAYTGAIRDRAGLIEKASKGTLFLDEIGDIKMASQVKLLRLLQDREYYPLGADVRRFSDTRIVVATNRNLLKLMEESAFREDLYYRLRTHQIHIPPLRERIDDLPVLVDHFVRVIAKEIGRKYPAIPHNLMAVLEGYNFPGNVRELESLIFDAMSRTSGRTLSMEVFEDLTANVSSSKRNTSAIETPKNSFQIHYEGNFPTLKEANELLIEQALERTNGNQTIAAQLLGLTRQALNKRLKRS